MDRFTFEIIMKKANGKLMTALENEIISNTTCTRLEANLLANHLLDIIDMSNEENNI